MYNNVGLRTPRGSGTSGHIMSNRSHVRPQAFRTGIQRNTGKLQDQNWQQEPPTKRANGELLDHQRKRKVEAKIFELQEAMAERGYNEEEIAAKVAEVRKGLEERVNNGRKVSLPSDSASGAMDSHMRGVKKEEDNRKMREAFGLGDDYAAGESFDQEAQERKREARKREREAKAAEREAKAAAKAAEEKRLRKDARRREKTGETTTPISEQAGPEKSRAGAGADAEASTNPEMPPPEGVRRGRGQFRAGGEKMEQAEGPRGRYGGRGPDQAGRGGIADLERGRGGDRDGGDFRPDRGDRGDSRDARISNAKDVLDRGLTTMRGRGRRYDGYPGGGYDDMERRSRGMVGKGRVGDERDRDRYVEGNAKHGVEDHYIPEVGVREAERWRPQQDREDESVGYEVNEIADRRENGQGKRRVEGDDDRDEFDDRDSSPSHKKSRPVPREVTVVEADRYYAQRRAESSAEKMRESRRGGGGGGAPSNGRDTAYDGDRDSDSDQHGVEMEQKMQERKGREVLIREVRHVPNEDRDTDRTPRKMGKEGKSSGERWLPPEDEDEDGVSKAKSRSRDDGGSYRGEKEASRAKGWKDGGGSPPKQQQQRRRREEDSTESDASAGDGERESSLRKAPRGKDDAGSREKHRDRGVEKPRPRSRKDEEREKMNHRRARDTDPGKSSGAGKGRRGREDRARGTKRGRGRSAESSSSSGSSSSSSSSSSTGSGSGSSRSSSSGSSSSKSPARRPAALRSPSGSSRSPSTPPARSRRPRRR